MNGDERKRKVPLDSLRIDLGPGGKASIGDRAGFATQFRRAGSSILAKAIDNRIGVATVIELLKHAPSNVDICAAFTVQEEIGLRGAKVAAQYFNPDLVQFESEFLRFVREVVSRRPSSRTTSG